MSSLLNDYLSRIELGEAQQCNNVVILPIFTAADHGPDYLTLTEALQQNLATVTEASTAGHVPEVRIKNASDSFVLLVDGEELTGAKQNRVLNTSILLAGKSETIVPVSCTEAGRWRYSSDLFADAGYVSSHQLRKIKSSSVAASLKSSLGHKSDQHAVWNAVHRLSASAQVQSPTSALDEVFKAKSAELNHYLEAFKPLPKQKGLVVLINGEVAGFDIVSSERAYRVLHPKLVKSFALDALLDQRPAGAENCREKALAFLEESKASDEKIYPTVGCGEDHRFESPKLAGSALVTDGHVVHLNLYRN